MPVVGRTDPRRPSYVAVLDGDARLLRLVPATTDDEVLSAVPPAAAVTALDAPLVVANPRGQRPEEHVLSWLDQPVFPSSTERLTRLYGGLRGVGLRDALRGRTGALVETVPDLVLRQLAWERIHPADADPVDLEEYRRAWVGVRAPRYRPKGLGRAVPAGRVAAAGLLADAVDLDGWLPREDPDDWEAIADAAQLDAMACAYLAWRLGTRPNLTVRLGDPRTPLVIPADANLRRRCELHLARLGAAGQTGRRA